MTTPFVYPVAPQARRHGPQGYADYQSYRPWPRDEFCFRCVYCLLREQRGRVRAVYAIDHFLPVAHHPTKVTDYDNLLYACATCNAAKGDRLLPDPLAVLTSASVRVSGDGVIHTDNAEAARLLECSAWPARSPPSSVCSGSASLPWLNATIRSTQFSAEMRCEIKTIVCSRKYRVRFAKTRCSDGISSADVDSSSKRSEGR